MGPVTRRLDQRRRRDLMATTVAVVGSRVEADLIAGMLLDHGLHPVVSGDDVGGIDLALQAQGVRVLVPDDEAQDARALLADGDVEATASPQPTAFARWLLRLLGGGRPED
jgi:Putative prokaryotic signal transducing protein